MDNCSAPQPMGGNAVPGHANSPGLDRRCVSQVAPAHLRQGATCACVSLRIFPMLLFPEERVKLRGELADLALALLPVLPPGQDDPAKQDPAAHAEEHPTEEAENDRCCPRLPTALACLGR